MVLKLFLWRISKYMNINFKISLHSNYTFRKRFNLLMSCCFDRDERKLLMVLGRFGNTLEICLYNTEKLVKIFQLCHFFMKMTVCKATLLAKRGECYKWTPTMCLENWNVQTWVCACCLIPLFIALVLAGNKKVV